MACRVCAEAVIPENFLVDSPFYKCEVDASDPAVDQSSNSAP